MIVVVVNAKCGVVMQVWCCVTSVVLCDKCGVDTYRCGGDWCRCVAGVVEVSGGVYK